MTEKRFTHKKWYNERQLFDSGEPFSIVDVYNQADKICDKLNKLHEKNQRLQKENKILYDENIQLRNKLLHFIQLKNDVKYLEEKGVF